MRAALSQLEVRRAENLADALDCLASGSWRPLAGGTDLMVVLAAGRVPERPFLDLSALDELRGITEDDQGFRIGALTTFTEVRECAALHRHLPNLIKSAKDTGAMAIQNRGTWGGNIVNASPAADTPPSLLAYSAELELVSVRGSRRVAYEHFHQGYKQMDLAADELVAAIHVPKPTGQGLHFFRKVGTRQAQAISKVCLAAYARLEAGRVAEFRVGIGAVAPVPLRARQAEAVILGRPITELPLAEARQALMADIAPIDDIRSTAHYRRVVAGNLLEACLRELTAVGGA